MTDFDVIVIGGGPAGSTAGAFCAQRGLRVALFEHAQFPRRKVCGDVINPNCWPIFERLGVAGQIRALPDHVIDGALFTTEARAVSIPMPRQTIAIRRDLLDAALLGNARALGVHVFERTTVHDLSTNQRVVTGAGWSLSARAIIGADGRHSITAWKAGLIRRVRTRNGHIAFQSHVRAPQTLDDRVQLHLFRGGYCGLVRVDGEWANLCIVTDGRGAQLHDDAEALFAHTVWRNQRFRELGIPPKPCEHWHSAHPLQSPMNLPARDGVFLAGDALRVMEPFTGQGIFFALRTAELAAKAICRQGDREAMYGAVVADLYRQRGRTNEWLRRVMYCERAARVIVPVVERAPQLARWLADNVLGGER